MSANEKVIFVAKASQEAHFLKNVLADAGIAAVVHNEAVEGTTGLVSGWPTAARVLVGERDVFEARRIAMEFDRQSTEAAADAHSHGATGEPTQEIDWPTCPECGHARLVRCPICHTTGNDFEPVDMGFEWIPGVTEQAQASCGPDGCGCHGSCEKPADEGSEQGGSAVDSDDAATAHAEGDANADPPGEDWAKNMLMCHMCDEPFAAEYASVCPGCGHEFGDGIEIEILDHVDDQLGHRAFMILGGLLAVAAAIIAYFASI